MTKRLMPFKLLLGDTVGIVSPSAFIEDDLSKIETGFSFLKSLGFKLKLGKNFRAKDNQNAGSPTQRASDINEMFADKEVKAIFCTLGGDSGSQILALLDYELIKNNPKIFIGFSDITHLLLAIYQKTGLVTFHGPNINILPFLDEESKNWLADLILGKNLVGKNLFGQGKVIKPGRSDGKLLGGNLFVMNCLADSGFSPDYSGLILFWEEIGDKTGTIQTHLKRLKSTGALGKISGMVIGHLHNLNSVDSAVEEILLEMTKDYYYPIIKTDNFGHETKRFLTLPIGIKAEIDTEEHSFILSESSLA